MKRYRARVEFSLSGKTKFIYS